MLLRLPAQRRSWRLPCREQQALAATRVVYRFVCTYIRHCCVVESCSLCRCPPACAGNRARYISFCVSVSLRPLCLSPAEGGPASTLSRVESPPCLTTSTHQSPTVQCLTGIAFLAERLEAGTDGGGGWFSNDGRRGRHHVFQPGSRALPPTRRDQRPGRGGGDGGGGWRA